MSIELQNIQTALEALRDPEKQRTLPRFFKTGKGDYGEGDRFLGITVPNIRSVARQNLQASESTLSALLESPWHEHRMCALLILVEHYKEASPSEQEAIVGFYLSHLEGVNNWDLVDFSAPYLLGAYLQNHPHQLLYTLAASQVLWEQRIAMVSTWPLIGRHQFTDTLRLAEIFLHHPHDLMQKATGWMLREVGKNDRDVLLRFLDAHASEMPRTMLRYAIEKLNPAERKYYLKQ